MPRYKIGKLAEEVGVTPDFLKHYEKYNILEPEVDEATNYRYYDIYHAGRFVSTKTLRNLGFSIRETEEILLKQDLTHLINRLQAKQQEISAEAARLQNLLPCVARLTEQATLLQQCQNQWFIQYREGHWFFPHTRDEAFIEDAAHTKLVPTWMELLPFSERALRADKAYLQGHGEYHFSYGIQISESLAATLGVDTAAPVEYVPPSRYFVYVQSDPTTNRSKKGGHWEKALETIAQQNFTPCGDGYCVIPFNTAENGVPTSHRIVWVPIE